MDIHIGKSWRTMTQERIIYYIQKLSTIIADHVDERAYKETQRKMYNSAETDFRIKFKQEIIAKNILFVKKKKYSFWCVDIDGQSVDKLETTGLEVIRSETPSAVKPRLKNIMEMILKNKSEDEITKTIELYKKELMDVYPEEISVNTSVSTMDKYIKPSGTIKGTPWHIKGVYNYRRLLNMLKIKDKYEDIHEGDKTKVVYVMKNQFGIETITFIRWPVEFNELIQIDKMKMIDKYFINKVKILLEPMNKIDLLESSNKMALDSFFG
jgi:DNA polymerase elongation subunit (family B)